MGSCKILRSRPQSAYYHIQEMSWCWLESDRRGKQGSHLPNLRRRAYKCMPLGIVHVNVGHGLTIPLAITSRATLSAPVRVDGTAARTCRCGSMLSPSLSVNPFLVCSFARSLPPGEQRVHSFFFISIKYASQHASCSCNFQQQARKENRSTNWSTNWIKNRAVHHGSTSKLRNMRKSATIIRFQNGTPNVLKWYPFLPLHPKRSLLPNSVHLQEI